MWKISDRCDPAVKPLADRHYNRQTPESPQFAPPGRCVVLSLPGAFWITSWPRYARHAWEGAWICSAFRNERPDLYLSSALILDAIAATRAIFGEPPSLGMITFVDPCKTRRKRDPGRCFRKAGFLPCGVTQEKGLIVLQLLPDAMPLAVSPRGFTPPPPP